MRVVWLLFPFILFVSCSQNDKVAGTNVTTDTSATNATTLPPSGEEDSTPIAGACDLRNSNVSWGTIYQIPIQSTIWYQWDWGGTKSMKIPDASFAFLATEPIVAAWGFALPSQPEDTQIILVKCFEKLEDGDVIAEFVADDAGRLIVMNEAGEIQLELSEELHVVSNKVYLPKGKYILGIAFWDIYNVTIGGAASLTSVDGRKIAETEANGWKGVEVSKSIDFQEFLGQFALPQIF